MHHSVDDKRRLKLVVIGDGAAGKTNLIATFRWGQFQKYWSMTLRVDRDIVKEVNVDGEQIELELFDTPGQDDYDRLRPLSYPQTDVVLICFPIERPDSLKNILDKWAPEVLHFFTDPPVPYILVGCKMDLRTDEATIERLANRGETCVTEEQGKELVQRIGARMYLECSALTNENVTTVFKNAAREALLAAKQPTHKQPKTAKKCNIL